MKSLFEDLSNDEYKTLVWVLHNQGSTPADFFYIDPTVDGRISELERNNLITINETDGALNITELGRAAIVEHDNLKKSERKSLIWEIVRFVIPTVISIAALVISILK